MDDPHRLQSVDNHGQGPLEDLRRQLLASHEKIIETLGKVTNSDLKLECEHITLGMFTLRAFIQRFFVGHDKVHVQQVTELLKAKE